MPKVIGGLSEVFGLYDGFILDLWGVVHDGAAPFPDTLPALANLKKSGRKVWLLSNAPRRAHTVVKMLEGMGIARSMYDGILTSGEASWHALSDHLLAQWGRRCFHLGKEHNASLYEGLDVEIVKDPDNADFVLTSSVLDFSDPAEKYLPVLEKMRRPPFADALRQPR